MAAPAGNQFWKRRNKHGRDKLFASPDLLWKAATEYFNWVDKNPLMEVVLEKIKVNGLGDQLKQVPMPKMRPYTITGLCLYLDCSYEYFKNFEQNNKDSKDFMPTLTRIREIIYTQKFEGAAAGFLNSNLIARDLGLADKKELKAEVQDKKFDYSKLTTEELEQMERLMRIAESGE